MLAIEEEYGGWDECYVKVLGVHWDSIYIHNVYVSHLGDSYLVLGQLRTCGNTLFITVQECFCRVINNLL